MGNTPPLYPLPYLMALAVILMGNKSIHNPDTYQQTWKDRLQMVTASIDKRLQYRDKQKQWQRFDASSFFNWLQLEDICTPEDAPEVKAALHDLCEGVGQTVIDAAWAWYAIRMAAEYDTDSDTIFLAYQCLMGETEGAKQARRRRGSQNWCTPLIINICKEIRRGNAPATQAEMFNALAERPESWIDSETDRYGDTTITFTSEGHKPHDMQLSGFKYFEKANRDQIGKKKI